MRMFDSFSCPSSNTVVSFHSQTFHDSCRAEHSSCFKPWPMRQFKLLWKQLALFGSLLYIYIYIFVDFKPEHKPHPRSAATNLTGCTTQMFITPTYRETNQQPNLQQAVALLTFTAQCFSYPSSFSFFSSLVSQSQQLSNLQSGFNQFGECLKGWRQIPEEMVSSLCSDTDGIHHLDLLSVQAALPPAVTLSFRILNLASGQ